MTGEFFRCDFFWGGTFSEGVEDFLSGQIFGEVDFLGTSQWEEGEFSCGGEFLRGEILWAKDSFFSGLKFFWRKRGIFCEGE